MSTIAPRLAGASSLTWKAERTRCESTITGVAPVVIGRCVRISGLIKGSTRTRVCHSPGLVDGYTVSGV